MSAKWISGKLTVVLCGKVRKKQGRSYNGLGIVNVMEAVPEFHSPAATMVFHLGTGHGLCILQGDSQETTEVATQLAELGDWTFDTLAGWRNRFPDVGEKLRAVRDRHPEVLRPLTGEQDEELAREVFGSR